MEALPDDIQLHPWEDRNLFLAESMLLHLLMQSGIQEGVVLE